MSIRVSKWYPLTDESLWGYYKEPFTKDLNRLARATNEQQESIALYMLQKDTENTSFYHAFVTERELTMWTNSAQGTKQDLRYLSGFFAKFSIISMIFAIYLVSTPAFICGCVFLGISFILFSASYLCSCKTREYKLYEKSLRMAQYGNTS